ncbi:MAG: type I glyceraldehyde-3-phosphate dehydrogenase [Streptosporangiales bacterium]|nr:type I glyceraldehyde-3-phosphate dehydrogenase [Streptosporangiales bacterium]
MTTRVAVNGFGRVGRSFLRAARGRGLEVVAVNDITDGATLAHLLASDSTLGAYPDRVVADEGALLVGDAKITLLNESDPNLLDWESLGVDIVIEATGRMRTADTASTHIARGARKVLVSAPGKNLDFTAVYGINHTEYDPERHHLVSAASCTTNCVVPMVTVLHRAYGLEAGLMTTVHAYTSDQSLLDGPHKDPRRARAAAVNIIPTSTGAARTAGVVLPELAGRLDGVAVRVPVEDGSLTDLTLMLDSSTDADAVNAEFQHAADDGLAGILRYSEAPLVSRDIIGDPASCVFDASLTQAMGRLVKVFGWYDNEYGYSSRLVDMATYMGRFLS